MIDIADIERFVADVRMHPDADFYRNVWGDAETFNELPFATRDALARCPLSRRSYKKEQGLARVVHGASGPYLCAWSFSDIAREPYGMISQRPLICFSDSHDTIEKSMWSYLNHMVPLAGEKNMAVTQLAARAFDVDSVIADPAALEGLLPYLEERTEPLSSISLVSFEFNPEQLMHYRRFAARIRLVLSLPETGAFAEAALSDAPHYTLLDNCLIEADQKTIVLTKRAPLITPIIRFDTGIPVTVMELR